MPQGAHQTQFHTDFREYLNKWFSLTDLETLCFDLDIPFDEVRGDGLDSTIVRLIFYCERHGRISSLLKRCSDLRPHAPLPESVYEPEIPPFSIVRIDKLPRRIKWMIVVGISTVVLVVTLGLLGHRSICSSLVIDPMENPSGWDVYADRPESRVALGSVPGRRNDTLAVLYDMQESGWLGFEKAIRRGALLGAEGIGFYYTGTGASNTITVKLRYESGAVFGMWRHRATSTNGWVFLQASIAEFGCWRNERCSASDKLNMGQVAKIDITLSNEQGDQPGLGLFAVDDFQAIKPWSWICAR